VLPAFFGDYSHAVTWRSGNIETTSPFFSSCSIRAGSLRFGAYRDRSQEAKDG
jgi:hypothetical protein